MKITFLFVLLAIAIANAQSYNYLELEISSTSPISASFTDQIITSTISQYSLRARGVQLNSFIVQNENNFFKYQRRVSPTQYSSSLGVFSFGESYVVKDFNFTVSVINTSSPSFNISPVLVVFYPFYKISVNEENAEYNFLTTTQAGEFLVATDSSYSLSGLTFTNPIYGIQNATLFPDFNYQQEQYNANIVCQFETEDSPFLTFPCYMSTSIIMSQTVDIFDCQFESFSFSGFSGSFSFSLDENGFRKDRNDRPDNMAFSLF